ncbi:MAG: DNA polymerase III subunit alpha [Bacteroidia bacterium]|nr:DNA polymerase III subunit alpha [Bacteroidia bacterium]
MYINCHTCYSLRYGIISEVQLLQIAQRAGARRVVLTDVNNTSACLNFIRLAAKYDIKPLIGIDFRDGARQLYVGIAKNNEGFLQLNRFLSHHKHCEDPWPEEAPELPDVQFIYPFEQVLRNNKTAFANNEWIGIGVRDLPKLRFSRINKYQEKLVVLNSFTFRNKRDFNLHRLLRAIDNNMLLSKLPPEAQANETNIFYSIAQLRSHYKDYPGIIENTEALLDTCSIYFDFSKDRKHQNKLYYGASAEEDYKLICDLCYKGLSYRYDKVTKKICDRLKKELELIRKMEFIPFFLINWDIISYAKSKGYFHVGRGSGANSIVAYLLGITDVDPIELDLYFERFMNLYRTSPPDFDIDFSWRDREDVTRYIFERFRGHDQVALLATYNTFQHSAAVRELGKVFGLPKHEIDKLSDGKFTFKKLDKLSQLVVIYANRLNGMPNYLSVHSAGIIISEKPIHYFTATELPPKGFPTTQFDMVIAEDVGLFKYDILGQRGLGKIKDALAIVRANYPDAPKVDIHNVKPFLVDSKINAVVRKAQCMGCFYVESPAMRMLLSKLEVDSYLGLVAASSIIRPGVAQSGMMREYILRHKNPDRCKEAHPVMLDIMPETYGVMVYQEDVIKVAHYFAGLDLGEADVLRRGMSGKYRSREEFQKVKEKFIQNCRDKGYKDELTLEIWRQTESFAGYAFAKGHSASYAVESYQSLYLKTYYPREYMVAVLNNGGGFYRPEVYVHEARQQGGIIHPPCVNHSHYETVIEGKKIYLGFQHLSGLETRVALRIVQEREEHGIYKSFEDFMDRVVIGIEQLDILIRIDAFWFSGQDKRTLLWKAYYMTNHQSKIEYQRSLFKMTARDFELPDFSITDLENAYDQIELLGFPLYDPFILLKASPSTNYLARDMKERLGKIMTIYGYLVTVKRTSTNKGKRMFFGTFLDMEGRWIDTVHFPPVAAKYPFRGKGIYKLVGKIVEEFDYVTMEISQMERMPYIEDPRYALNDKKKA